MGNARVRAVVLLTIALLLLAGCGRGTGSVVAQTGAAASTTNGAVAQTGAAAATSNAAVAQIEPPGCPPPPPVGQLPPPEQVTAVKRCVGSLQRVPGDGEWWTLVEQRVAGATLTPLTTALALPSEPPSSGACPAVADGLTAVIVETSSGAVTVKAPQDGCGLTRHEVHAAYDALGWVTVATTKDHQLRSEAAVTGNCSDFKDMIALNKAVSTPAPGPSTGAAAVSVCRYDAVDGQRGTPTGGRALTPEEGRRVATLVAAARPAAACTQPHTRFAVVISVDNQWMQTELDGCRRIFTENNQVSQAGDELVTLLTS